jgi:hypothetical protein
MTAGVPSKQVGVFPPNSGSILVEIASGATAQLMPAPPAGYLNILGFVRIKNLSGANALSYTIQDGAGNVVGASSSLAAAAQASAIAGPMYSATAITATVAGTGGPAQFSGFWSQVPIEGPYRKLVPFVLNATLAPQAIPQCVPPAGYVANTLGADELYGAFATWQLNRDSASATFIWRITRSAVVWEGNTLAAQSANSRGYSLWNCPAVLPGDTLECRLLAAPVAPNTVWCGGLIVFYPLVS